MQSTAPALPVTDDRPAQRIPWEELVSYSVWHSPSSAQQARETTCDRCEYPGMHFKGFQNADSHRAFMVCPNCGDAQEF